MSGQPARPEAIERSTPSALTPDPDTAYMRQTQARRVALRRTLAIAVAASALVVGAIGWWTHHAVESSMRDTRGAALRSTLDAHATSLEVWIEDQKLMVARIAADRALQESADALVAIARRHGTDPAGYCAAPERRRLVEHLDAALAGTGAVTFNLVDTSGRIIASKQPDYCGASYRDALRAREIAPVFDGQALFLPPADEQGRLESPPAVPLLDRSLIWIRTPIREPSGGIVAALGVGHFGDAQFSALLGAGRGSEGGSEEAYAFDARGMMLSRSRFAGARDDAKDLPSQRQGFAVRPALAPADARTRLVEAARAHSGPAGKASGILLDPYPGYRGDEVVGAWRRVPVAGLYLAIEMSAEEAYAPLEALRAVFAAVLGVLAVAIGVALAAWFREALVRGELEKNRVGPYWLGERIGEGGVGSVFRARHDLLKRPSAVKLLKPSRATDEMTARFQREAQLASQLRHPNMVEIYDYGRGIDGSLYYAMEFLDGDTVGSIVSQSGAMPVARAVHLLRQTCAGLAEAHGRGLVHRDISVTNLMACHHAGEYDFLKILDFGLVKQMESEQSQTITRNLRILGTPQYMAPERLRDPADVDARADVYAVGAVAFFLLAGRRMFETADTLALTSRVLNEPPPRLAEVAAQEIPAELDRLVAQCLEKDREARPPGILAVKEVLDALALRAPWSQAQARAAWRAMHPEDAPSPG